MNGAALDAPAAIDGPGPAAAKTTGAFSWSARWWRVLVTIGLLLTAFAIVEHDLIFANASVKGYGEDELRDRFIQQIKDGNRARQVALLTFGATGIAMIALCPTRRWNIRWSVAAPLLMLFLLSIASVAWSVQPGITAKRLAVLVCLCCGAAGLSRFLTPTEFLRAVLFSLIGFVTASLAIDIAFGGRPWQISSFGEYRFGGTLHPNAQAAYCGVMCVAAACLPVGFGRRWMTRGVVLIGLAAIVLTQSRTGLLSVLLALVFVAVLRLPRLLRMAGIAAVIAAASGAFVVWHSVGDGVRNRAVDAAMLGRSASESKSLTGRVPLWDELAEYAARKPVLGYGYEGFWTPKRIAAIMKSQNWTVQNAHNSYFEVMLQLGFVGLILAVWLLLGGLRLTTQAFDITRDAGYAFAAGVIVLGMVNSGLESLFVKLRFPPIVALTAIMSVALFFPFDPSDGEDDVTPTPLATS